MSSWESQWKRNCLRNKKMKQKEGTTEFWESDFAKLFVIWKKCSKYESQRWRVSKEIKNLNWSHVFFIPHLVLLLWFYKFNTFSTIFLLPLLEGRIFLLFWVKMRFFSFAFLSFSYSLFYPLTYEYFLHVYFSCFAKQ